MANIVYSKTIKIPIIGTKNGEKNIFIFKFKKCLTSSYIYVWPWDWLRIFVITGNQKVALTFWVNFCLTEEPIVEFRKSWKILTYTKKTPFNGVLFLRSEDSFVLGPWWLLLGPTTYTATSCRPFCLISTREEL